MKKLVVMYGGPGGEHEVSINSGRNIISALDKSKYEVEEMKLPKNFKKFKTTDLKRWRQNKVLVLPIMHGRFGEGGQVQSILEKNKIEFVGCNSKVSKICIDKVATQKVLEKNKILVPKSFLINKNFNLKKIFSDNKKYIIKQVDGGSSVDLNKANSKHELELLVEKMIKKYDVCLVQEFIAGREFTCGIVQIGKRITALPVSEIVLTKGELFDYTAKYSVDGCQEITPANIDKKLQEKIQTVSKKVFKILGCRDIGRVDMILGKDKKLYVLEINTIPGLTKTSFLPQQLDANKMTMSNFLDIIISNER